MSKHKRRGEVKRYHLYLGASGMLAAVALVTAVAFGMTSAEFNDQHMMQQCPTGYTGTPPNCTAVSGSNDQNQQQQQQCPTGTTGTYPNCVQTQCPTGYTGTPPNCTAATCPTGQTGTPPNCTSSAGGSNQNPASFTGNASGCQSAGFLWCPTVNDCFPAGGQCSTITSTCPTGQTGTPPNCTSSAGTTQCPAGTTGTPPNCTPASGQQGQCPAGSTGTYPNCVQTQCPTGYTGTPPNCVGTTQQGKDPFSYRGNEAGCTAAGFLWCSNANDCVPAGGRCPTNEEVKQFRHGTTESQGPMCGPPPFCPFGHKPPATQPAPETCPTFECNEPPAGFEKMQMGMPQTSFYPGFGQGKDVQEQHEGQSFECPPDDFFCQKFAGEHDFSKYQLQFDTGKLEEIQNQYGAQDLNREGKQLKQEARQLEREAAQIKSQIERVGKRAGVYCPAVSNYSAALSTIETVVAQWKSAKTPEELAAAIAAKESIHGSPDDPTSGIFRKLHGYFDPETQEFVQGLDQEIGQCEGAGHAFNELERVCTEGARMLKKAQSKGAASETIEALEEWVNDCNDLKENPPDDFFDAPNFNECPFGGGPGGGIPPFESKGGFGPGGPGGFGPGGPGGFGPPQGFGPGGFEGFSAPPEFQEQFEKFMKEKQLQGSADASRLVAQMGFPEFEGEQPIEFEGEPTEEDLACMPGFARYMMQLMKRFGKLMREVNEGFAGENICGEIDRMVEMAADFEGKVPDRMYRQGLKLLDEGQAACSEDPPDIKTAQRVIFRMHTLGGGMRRDEEEGEFEDEEKKFGLDIDDLIARKLAEIEGEVEKRVQKKLEQLLGILDEQAKIIAALEEQVSTLLTKLASVVDLSTEVEQQINQVIKAPEEVRDAILEPINDVIEVVETQLEKLPEEVADVVAPILEDHLNVIVESAPTETLAETLAEELEGVLTEMRTAEPEEAKELMEEYVKQAEKELEDVTPEDRVEAGQTKFADVAKNFEDVAKQWYFAPLHDAADRGIVKGTKDGEAQANKALNGAEFIAMVANGLDIEPKAGATSVEGVDFGKATWVAPLAAAVDEKLREEGSSLNEILEGKALDQPLPRIDAAEIIAHVEEIPEPSAEVLAEVREDPTLKDASKSEVEAAAALRDHGIMLGKGASGHFEGNATMLKVEGAAVVSRTQDAVGGSGPGV